MNFKRILSIIIIILISFFIGRCSKRERNGIEPNYNVVKDSLNNYYKSLYLDIDKIETRQQTTIKYRNKIIKEYDTIYRYLDTASVVDAFSNYKEI